MRFEDKITVKLNALDAAIASVLLAEKAGQLALNALLADRTAEVKDTRTLADAYIKVGQALAFAIMDSAKNRGIESTMTLVRSAALAEAAVTAADEVGTATEAAK